MPGRNVVVTPGIRGPYARCHCFQHSNVQKNLATEVRSARGTADANRYGDQLHLAPESTEGRARAAGRACVDFSERILVRCACVPACAAVRACLVAGLSDGPATAGRPEQLLGGRKPEVRRASVGAFASRRFTGGATGASTQRDAEDGRGRMGAPTPNVICL